MPSEKRPLESYGYSRTKLDEIVTKRIAAGRYTPDISGRAIPEMTKGDGIEVHEPAPDRSQRIWYAVEPSAEADVGGDGTIRGFKRRVVAYSRVPGFDGLVSRVEIGSTDIDGLLQIDTD